MHQETHAGKSRRIRRQNVNRPRKSKPRKSRHAAPGRLNSERDRDRREGHALYDETTGRLTITAGSVRVWLDQAHPGVAPADRVELGYDRNLHLWQARRINSRVLARVPHRGGRHCLRGLLSTPVPGPDSALYTAEVPAPEALDTAPVLGRTEVWKHGTVPRLTTARLLWDAFGFQPRKSGEPHARRPPEKSRLDTVDAGYAIYPDEEHLAGIGARTRRLDDGGIELCLAIADPGAGTADEADAKAQARGVPAAALNYHLRIWDPEHTQDRALVTHEARPALVLQAVFGTDGRVHLERCGPALARIEIRTDVDEATRAWSADTPVGRSVRDVAFLMERGRNPGRVWRPDTVGSDGLDDANEARCDAQLWTARISYLANRLITREGPRQGRWILGRHGTRLLPVHVPVRPGTSLGPRTTVTRVSGPLRRYEDAVNVAILAGRKPWGRRALEKLGRHLEDRHYAAQVLAAQIEDTLALVEGR